MKSKNLFIIVVFIFLIIFVSHTGVLLYKSTKKITISTEYYDYLKNTYSKDALNYFHEITFYGSDPYHQPHTEKWDSDIQLAFIGEASQNNKKYFSNAVKKINSLNLPIKLYITNDTTRANIKVYFGEREQFKHLFGLNSTVLAAAHIDSHYGIIQKARILITNSIYLPAHLLQ